MKVVIETADDYQKLAARTLIDGIDWKIPDLEMMLVWNSMGLVGEASEVVEILGQAAPGRMGKDILAKELGDVMWYIAAICTKFGVQLSELHEQYAPVGYFQHGYSLSDIGNRLAVASGKVAEEVKKAVFHQHGIDQRKITGLVFDVYRIAVEVCSVFSITVFDVWQRNIAKLLVRYPDGFAAADSVSRADVAR